VISKLRKELLAEARVYRLYQVQPDANATVILRLAENDAPLLLEKSVGRGKVLLCTTTADCEWSDIPRHPIFPLLMHQAVTYLTRRPFERSGLVGETLALPLADPTEPSVTFRDPRGKDIIVQAAPRDGQLTAELAEPEQVGFYSVRQGKSPQTTFVAINPNTVESDVAALAPLDLQASLKNLPVRLLDGNQLSGDIRNSRIGREFWQWALTLALAVFALESLLAWYFSRRIARANSLQAVREELLSPRRHDAV
jgi:hypothetical protein